MFKSIVVGFDGSAHAARALEIGAELAGRDDLPLAVVYVIDPSHTHIPEQMRQMGQIEHIIQPLPKMMINLENAPTAMMNSMAQANQDSEAALFQYADYLVDTAAADCRDMGAKQVETSVLQGDPAEKIVELAQQRQADLIITGCRGFGKLKRLLVGSTSQKINQLAECSCLTVH